MVSRLEAIDRASDAGLIPSYHGSNGSGILYFDADCNCCSSRYKVGELEVTEDQVDSDQLDEILDNFDGSAKP